MIFEWPVRVYIEDTDRGGIVYHANYLNYMERARTEWLRSLGFSQENFFNEDTLFVVRKVVLSYKMPAKLDDELIVNLSIQQRRRVGLTLSQQILLVPPLSVPQVLAEAEVELACVTRAGQVKAMPKDFMAALESA